MNKCSSTEYLDELLLSDIGLITRDTMDTVKGYCGTFAFVMSICNNDNLTDEKKVKLIDSIISSSILFMEKRYKANLDIYRKHASENLKQGKLFEALSEIPAKMQEDYEVGLRDAKSFLLTEVRDILKILNEDLDI